MKVPKFIVGCAVAFAILCILILSGCSTPQTYPGIIKNEEVVIEVVTFKTPPNIYFDYIDSRSGLVKKNFSKNCSSYRRERDNIVVGGRYIITITTTNYVDKNGNYVYSRESNHCDLLKQLPFISAA